MRVPLPGENQLWRLVYDDPQFPGAIVRTRGYTKDGKRVRCVLDGVGEFERSPYALFPVLDKERGA